MSGSLSTYFIMNNPLLIGVVVSLFVFLILRRLEIGLALLTATNYLNQFIIGSTTLLLIIAIITVVSMASYWFRYIRGHRFKILPSVIFISAFTTWIILNFIILRSAHNTDGYGTIVSFLFTSFLPFVGLFLIGKNGKRIKNFLVCYVFLATLTTILMGISVAGYITSINDLENLRFHWLLFRMTAGSVGRPLACACIFSISLISIEKDGVNRLLFLIATLILLFALFTTSSRSLLVALFLGIMFYFGISKRFHLRQKLLIVIPIIIVALLGLVFTNSGERYNELLSENVFATESFRLERYKEALDDFYSSPIFGIGMGEYGKGWITVPSRNGIGTEYVQYSPHNLVLAILAELGITGFLLCFLTVGYGLYKVGVLFTTPTYSIYWPNESEITLALGITIVVSLISNQFNGSMSSVNEMLWPIGAISSLLRYYYPKMVKV